MGKNTRKGYNWKSRQVVETVIDDSSTKKIKLDLNVSGYYDQSNELVLPSEKRKTKLKHEKTPVKILSKKHRKRLETIVDKKLKKANRASLLEALSTVQATPEELKNLTSIATLQTKGLKRHLYEELHPSKKEKREEEVVLNSLSGAKLHKEPPEKVINTDPNVVGFESESDEDSESENEQLVPQEVEEIKPVSALESTPVAEPISVPQPRPVVVQCPVKQERKPAVFVDVTRLPEVQEARLKLPILAEEQQIMEIINENPVVIIAGETGSGKTTQVPQFLYEGGYALSKQIAITEPRRVAAISMSKRVAHEMNLTNEEVSYLIRFEGNVTDKTKIKFMTDGVLLKELQGDFLLTKYSVVILDEAHERSVYTDILIGLLSRIVPLRQKRGDPLKLIIMSATLRIEDFTSNPRLFRVTPPVIKVDTRQFPVTIHFNRSTHEDYLAVAYEKTVKIHTKLPEGGILIFLTGQQEVNTLVRRLRRKFPIKNKQYLRKFEARKKEKTVYAPVVDLDSYSIDWSSDQELDEIENLEIDRPLLNAEPLWVLPLYSMLPAHKQNQVFEPPPTGCRLCIVSTNVAETSLTIPNVKYVVDCGRSKVKLYDKTTGVTSHVVTWTSKASADQRAGRAGRTGPGHCYRIYSSAVFNDTFPEFSVPEIQEKPVDDLFLQMKCLNIDKIVNFPFPTAPDLLQLKTAEKRLEILQVLSKGKPTALGKAVSKFPVLPRFGKMLALSHQEGLLPYTICLVAALSVPEVLLERPLNGENDGANWVLVRRQWAGPTTSCSFLLGDNMVLLKAVGAAEFAHSQGKLSSFCLANGLREKGVTEIRKLRVQLTNHINATLPNVDAVVDPLLSPPSDLQAKLLRQILLSGMGDQVARKIQPGEGEDVKKLKYAYHTNNMKDPIYLHSGSVLRKSLPDYVIYTEIYETNKIYMRGVTAIEPEWLPLYAPNLCNLSQPLPNPEPVLKNFKVYCTVSGSFGSRGWELPNVEIEHPLTINYYKWWARFLLEGEIFGMLKRYKDQLLSQPNIMVKSWAKLQPRTDAILKVLVAREVTSKAKLEEIWRTEPKFLLEEYLRWVPQSAYQEITLLWPPLD